MADRNPQKRSLEELCILLHFQAVTLTEMDSVLQTCFRTEKQQNASAGGSIFNSSVKYQLCQWKTQYLLKKT